MIETEIKALQSELNRMIDIGAEYSNIYEISIRLDRLIVQYYNERMAGTNRQ